MPVTVRRPKHSSAVRLQKRIKRVRCRNERRFFEPTKVFRRINVEPLRAECVRQAAALDRKNCVTTGLTSGPPNSTKHRFMDSTTGDPVVPAVQRRPKGYIRIAVQQKSNVRHRECRGITSK